MKLKLAFITGAAAILAGCATAPATQQGAAVELVTERPKNCKFVGEVTGSHGNVFAGDFISDERLIQGARNDLRNKAAAMGANVVQVQNTINSKHPYSAGIVKSTVVGGAFQCAGR